MILYSIVPEEIVFGKSAEGMAEVQNAVEMDYMGAKVIAVPSGNNQLTIARLISTSPKAYLNPALQPGTVIRR